jgi:hypothetical protein
VHYKPNVFTSEGIRKGTESINIQLSLLISSSNDRDGVMHGSSLSEERSNAEHEKEETVEEILKD